MKFTHVVPFLLLNVILLQCISSDALGPEGEGNGSETTARGIIVDSTGAPVAAIPIQILPTSYNPLSHDTLAAEWHTVTGIRGEYNFKGIGAGSYNIEAGAPGTGLKALVKNIELTGQKIEVDVDTGRLQETGTALINLTGMELRNGDYIYLPGTNAFTVITAADSFAAKAVVSGIPAGVFTDIIYVAATDSQNINLLRDTLTIQPGDTLAFAYAAWKFSTKLGLNTTVSGADIQQNIYDFPVLVRLNDGVFDFLTAKSDGEDIRFAKSDGTPLAFEIERWDSTTRKAEIWVKIDTIYGNDSTQYITMHWGNADAVEGSDGKEVFDTACGFTGVWHMNQEPSTEAGSIKDCSANASHATSYSMEASNSVEGTIGKALTFNGTDEYLNAGNVPVSGHYSIGLWVRTNTSDYTQRFVFKDSSYTLWYDRINVSIRMEHMGTGAQWLGLLQNGGVNVSVTTGAWRYLTGTFDGTTIRIYENGTEVSRSDQITDTPLLSSTLLLFGKSWYADYVNGTMDEIRIERTARSADWLKLCYMNQREEDKLVIFNQP